MFITPIVMISVGLTFACRDLLDPQPAERFAFAPYVGQDVDVAITPTADTYIRLDAPDSSFGTDTLLRVGSGSLETFIKWDSAAIAAAIAGDSLASARIEFTIVGNGWGQTGSYLGISRVHNDWDEQLTYNWWHFQMCFGFPCVPQPIKFIKSDSVFVTTSSSGVLSFDVTADVRDFLTASPNYRQGWVARGGNGTLDLGSREGSSPPRLVLTVHRQTPQVPAVAPDTFPSDMFDRSNVRDGTPCITGRVLKNVLVILFQEGSTQQQKQSAVDLVGGVVIGGLTAAFGEGYYYVRIADEATGQLLCDAIAQLNALPQVDYASEVIPAASSFHRQPNDSVADWRIGEWSIDPFDASGDNWGLERIAAPLAWGCAVGNGGTAIAVLDHGFHSVEDLLGNVSQTWRTSFDLPNDTADHGTKVASILAAEGDNNRGMTGAMWKADLRPYDVSHWGSLVVDSVPPEFIAIKLRNAVNAGASIINISYGLDWRNTEGRLPVPGSRDTVRVNRFRTALSNALERIPANSRPLVVLAAGNDGISAYWAGFPNSALDFPDHVLVVGASTINNTLWTGLLQSSNSGPLVNVVAPGAGVGALDRAGVVHAETGTSFAAPMVAGIAGLLNSFDPALPPATIRQFIVEGAARAAAATGIRPGGIDLVNAYESLKRAAEETGAPLCGNHVWSASGGRLWTLRGSADSLATIGAPVGFLEVLHGGKYIRYVVDVMGTPTIRYIAWNAGSRGWSSSSAPDASVLRGGTLRSTIGRSHDRDSIVVVQDSLVNVPTTGLGSRWYDGQPSAPAFILAGDTTTQQEVGSITVSNLPEPISNLCVEEHVASGICTLTVYEQRRWRFRVAYPQYPEGILQTLTAFVSVSAEQVVPIDSTITAWHTCNFSQEYRCREFSSREVHRGTTIYAKNLRSQGSPDVVQTLPNESVYWMAQGESGRDVVLGRGKWDKTHSFSPESFHAGVPAGSPGFVVLTNSVESCTIEYRLRVALGTVLGAPIPAESACTPGSLVYDGTLHPYSGAGTIAPRMSSTINPWKGPPRRPQAIAIPFTS